MANKKVQTAQDCAVCRMEVRQGSPERLNGCCWKCVNAGMAMETTLLQVAPAHDEADLKAEEAYRKMLKVFFFEHGPAGWYRWIRTKRVKDIMDKASAKAPGGTVFTIVERG